MLVLICFQTVCKDYQLMTKVTARKERVKYSDLHFNDILNMIIILISNVYLIICG